MEVILSRVKRDTSALKERGEAFIVQRWLLPTIGGIVLRNDDFISKAIGTQLGGRGLYINNSKNNLSLLKLCFQ